jgi:protein disulfide-isomerase A6
MEEQGTIVRDNSSHKYLITFKNRDLPRAVLLNKANKLPLLWVVLSNQFSPTMSFGSIRDRRGMISKALGFPHKEEHKKPKIILYEPGKKDPVMYEGLLKYDTLRDFLQKFSKGEADLSGLLKVC